jgi:hypothetical protein
MTVTPPPPSPSPDPASGSAPHPGAGTSTTDDVDAGGTAPGVAAPASVTDAAHAAAGIPPLPALISELAGSAYAHACEGGDLDQVYRDLATGRFSPDPGPGSLLPPAPCASLLVPPGADGLAQTLLSRVDPPSDLPGPALLQLFTGLSTLQTHLLGKYGHLGWRSALTRPRTRCRSRHTGLRVSPARSCSWILAFGSLNCEGQRRTRIWRPSSLL